MRWFWIFILGLCVLFGVLYVKRTRAEQAAIEQQQAALEAERSEAPVRRPRRTRTADTTPEEPTQTQLAIVESVEDPAEQVEAEPAQSEPVAELEPVEQVKETAEPVEIETEPAEPLGQEQLAQPEQPVVEEVIAEEEPQQEVAQPEPVGDIVIEGLDKEPEPAPPTFELNDDGSFKILATNTTVLGSGAQDDPYVLNWDLLSSISRIYDPRKGNETLPDWLGLLDGKVVTIEGSTLVPVIASSTRELLIMKNPWDGCHMGVPPTPYEAVEIALNHDVDFGSSALGYGSVEGMFYVDPYVVDGWVLGVYIMEDAKFRMGEGFVFPQF